MTHERKGAKRTLAAPGSTAPMSGGEVLCVEVGPDEDVEWVWSHDRERGSTVTGYRIVSRENER